MGKKIKDPGIGNSSSKYFGRLIDNNGQFNVIHINKAPRFSETYNYLIGISWFQFFALAMLSYVLLNVLFAFLYCGVGIHEITPSKTPVQNFFNAFFFSTQTFTTVGYGAMAPNGSASAIVASVESFFGLMFFAFVTSLLYGRFSKPRAAIRFSKHLIFSELNKNKALMFRIENNRLSTMINPKVAVTLILPKPNKKGEYINTFYNLDLERKTIDYLPTTWTLVHTIQAESPFCGVSGADIKKMQGELIVMVSYYDEAFSQEVHQMYSYLLSEIQVNFKFVKAYHYNDKGIMVLDHKLFDVIEPIKR